MRAFLRVPPLLALAGLVWLAGCAAPKVAPPKVPQPVPPASGATVVPPPVAPATTTAAPWNERLEAVASRLRGSIAGNGVEVSQTTDQRLWVSLPAETAFAPGRSALTPAAGGWLDQVAASLKTLPRAQVQIVGPADPRGGGALAVDRAASARDWMVMRGVPAARMAVSGPAAKPKDATAVPARLEILVGER